jgi:DnaJ-domain-containing protein 1
MFGKADPAANLKRWRVMLHFRSAEVRVGALLVPAHRSLREALNDEAPFLEFESHGGERSFLLKTEIGRVDPLDAPEPREDRPERSRFEANDASLVLGISPDAPEEDIHRAWRDLAKAYHPDRLVALGLPDEMLRHADRVLARINAAFQSLKAARQAKK